MRLNVIPANTPNQSVLGFQSVAKNAQYIPNV